MYKKSITHYVSKIAVDVLFYLSIICTLCVPFLSSKLFIWIGYPEVSYMTAFTIMLFLSGICCVLILLNLKLMFRTIMVGNPFIDKNVNYMRRIAVLCAAISMIYIIKCFFMFTFATMVIAVVFAVGCLFCLTLKDLFKQAENYKTENDLTI